MANPSSPSRAPRKAPQRKPHRYIDALFTDDFGRRSKLTTESANSFARKRYDRASQALQLHSERVERKARRIEIREWRAAMRSLEAELRESDYRIRLMWRRMQTRVRPEKKVRHTPPTKRKRHWPYAAVALPKYDGPIIDRRGQRGVFMRVRYYSRRTAEAGVSQRVVKYCYNGAELDQDGNPYVATNIGVTIDEALCGFDHLEQVNWAAQKNAKLLMHGILAVDHRQTPDEMMTCGLRWAEECLGRFDLPYLVTLHAPPPDGDQRNWHLHVLWSFRPMVRTGDHQWEVAEMLRTDLDNPAAMRVFRGMFAAVMTDVSFEAGQNQDWTALSNADRGLPHEPQVHLGAARTNRARNGEYVDDNEENHERVMRSKAAVIDEALRHADEALAKAQDVARAFASRFARLPALPMRLPDRIAAAATTLDAVTIQQPPPLSSAGIVAPSPLPVRTESARVTGLLGPVGRLNQTGRRSTTSVAMVTPPKSIPRPARIEIANLRFRPLPLAKGSVGRPGALPTLLTRATIPALSDSPHVRRLRLADIGAPITPLPITSRASIARLPERTWFQPLPRLAGLEKVVRTVERFAQVAKREEERHKQEHEAVERDRRAAAAMRHQETLERMMLAITKERRFITRPHREYVVPIDIIERFDVSADSVATPDVQRQLAAIAEEQEKEISQIVGYISGGADRLRREDGKWALGDAAPMELRRLVDAWSADPLVDAAFGRFGKTAPPAPTKAPDAGDPAATWRSARHLRARAMKECDDRDRQDGDRRALPGRQPRLPGQNRAARPASHAWLARTIGNGRGDGT